MGGPAPGTNFNEQTRSVRKFRIEVDELQSGDYHVSCWIVPETTISLLPTGVHQADTSAGDLMAVIQQLIIAAKMTE